MSDANLRLRATQGNGLCLNKHVIWQADDRRTAGINCNGVRLATLELGDPVSHDRSDEIRLFMRSTMADHERAVAASVVLELLDRLNDRPMSP